MIIEVRHTKQNTSLMTKRKAYKVKMRSADLLRDKWVKYEVPTGAIVRDVDGRIFRVLSVEETVLPPITTSVLEVVNGP